MGGRNQVRRKNKIKRSLAFLSRLGYQPLFWKERRLANPRTSFLGVGSPFPRAARTACLERRLAICGFFFGMFYVYVILQPGTSGSRRIFVRYCASSNPRWACPYARAWPCAHTVVRSVARYSSLPLMVWKITRSLCSPGFRKITSQFTKSKFSAE